MVVAGRVFNLNSLLCSYRVFLLTREQTPQPSTGINNGVLYWIVCSRNTIQYNKMLLIIPEGEVVDKWIMFYRRRRYLCEGSGCVEGENLPSTELLGRLPNFMQNNPPVVFSQYLFWKKLHWSMAILLNKSPKPEAYWSGRSLDKFEELALTPGAHCGLHGIEPRFSRLETKAFTNWAVPDHDNL